MNNIHKFQKPKTTYYVSVNVT